MWNMNIKPEKEGKFSLTRSLAAARRVSLSRRN
jgi:hypothetical protein